MFYFLLFGSQLLEPHLLPSLAAVESLPAPPLTTPFALFTCCLSVTEDYLSSVCCQYFTAVGGESGHVGCVSLSKSRTGSGGS